jgi:hypothetical protein
MTTPLHELEGTWEKIVAQIPDFGRRGKLFCFTIADGNQGSAS